MFRELNSFSKTTFLVSAGLLSFLVPLGTETQPKPASSAARIYAQKLVEETLAAHPELVARELAATPPKRSQCVTIASSETKGIGEKCEKDEYTAMKTNKPFVEKEKEDRRQVYDVTIPIHDAKGKVITRLSDIHRLLAGDIQRAKSELAKHCTEITLTPEGQSYLISGDFEPIGRTFGWCRGPGMHGSATS